MIQLETELDEDQTTKHGDIIEEAKVEMNPDYPIHNENHWW